MPNPASHFRGARPSNAGDDYHELWAARQAIRLLANDDDLQALALEGLAAVDESQAAPDAWDGVDCTLYFGGRNAANATHITMVQVKYSSANPDTSWTVARLTQGKHRSVVARLARAWKELIGRNPSVDLAFVSNQPVDPEVQAALQCGSALPTSMPAEEPPFTEPSARLAFAAGTAGLTNDQFASFASALSFHGTGGSRLAAEGNMLRAVAAWTGPSIREPATRFRQFVRRCMMPETAGEIITPEDVRLQLVGASDEYGLFPCPSDLKHIQHPVSRVSVRQAVAAMQSGSQHVCLHGAAGTGKTTALQEIEAALPQASVMVVYDCYGSGRYLDVSALRHRPRDAFLQLTNELATSLRLPLFLTPGPDLDYPRLFHTRLCHAAAALADQAPDALLVVAADAADNAIVASATREESCFIEDLLHLGELPLNVRVLVTSRTGRLNELHLPPAFRKIEIGPFSQDESAEHARRELTVGDQWVEEFHHLSKGNPRVQAYALASRPDPHTVLAMLRPGGKTLSDIFRSQFDEAIGKDGTDFGPLLGAPLASLPTPIPLNHVAEVVQEPISRVKDACADLAPGLRVDDDAVRLADEDLEAFVREEAERKLSETRGRAADVLLGQWRNDSYAALNVAGALVLANRGEELLGLTEAEQALDAIADPALRREAEAQRLRLAIKVCRSAGDPARATRFILMGAEGIETETALRRLLVDSPDLAARFAPDTASRMILGDDSSIARHGPLLFHQLAVYADRQDGLSYRDGLRSIGAWLEARRHAAASRPHLDWPIGYSAIAGSIEAAFKLDGPVAAIENAARWRPRSIRPPVASMVCHRLLAEGHRGWGQTALSMLRTDPVTYLTVANCLALAGCDIDGDELAAMLARLNVPNRLKKHGKSVSTHSNTKGLALDAALTACEVLTGLGSGNDAVARVLNAFLSWDVRRVDRLDCYTTFNVDLIFRAYSLYQARAGHIAEPADVFSPRPQVAKDSKQKAQEDLHDSQLNGVANSVLGIYSAVAKALVKKRIDVGRLLDQARKSLEREDWQISRLPTDFRIPAARQVTALLAAGYHPDIVMQSSKALHRTWVSDGTNEASDLRCRRGAEDAEECKRKMSGTPRVCSHDPASKRRRCESVLHLGHGIDEGTGCGSNAADRRFR